MLADLMVKAAFLLQASPPPFCSSPFLTLAVKPVLTKSRFVFSWTVPVTKISTLQRKKLRFKEVVRGRIGRSGLSDSLCH